MFYLTALMFMSSSSMSLLCLLLRNEVKTHKSPHSVKRKGLFQVCLSHQGPSSKISGSHSQLGLGMGLTSLFGSLWVSGIGCGFGLRPFFRWILGFVLALKAFSDGFLGLGSALTASLSLHCASILMPHQNILLDDFDGVPDKDCIFQLNLSWSPNSSEDAD